MRMMISPSNASGQGSSKLPPRVFPEPYPDWTLALPLYQWSWKVHVYGFGALFSFLVLYDVVLVCVLRRRLRSQQFVVCVMVVVFVSCAAKMVYVLVDPYGSAGLVPPVALELLHSVTYPAMTTMLGALELNILAITKGRTVSASPSSSGASSSANQRLSSTQRLFYLYVSLHFAGTLLMYGWASLNLKFRLMIMLSQGLFITSGLIFCFVFIYNGYRVTEFTSETNRMFKQIKYYSKIRKHASCPALSQGREENHGLGAPSSQETPGGVAWPRLSHTVSEVDLESVGDSSDDLSVVYRENMTNVKQNLEKCIKRLNRRQRRLENGLQSSDSDCVTMSSIADDVTHTKCSKDKPASRSQLVSFASLSARLRMVFRFSRRKKLVNDRQMSFDQVPSDRADLVHFQVNAAFDKDSHCGSQLLHHDQVGSTTVAAPEETSLDVGYSGTPGGTVEGILCGVPEDCTDGGYLADTEVSITKGNKDSGTKRAKEPSSGYDEDDEEICSDPEGQVTPGSLPPSSGPGGCVHGLHRLRQGRLLKKVHRMTYVAVVFVFSTCVLQVYAMFGDLGVLSRQKSAEPWPWYIYHTLSRFCEFCSAAVMLFVAHRIGSQKYRHKRKRDVEKNQTTC